MKSTRQNAQRLTKTFDTFGLDKEERHMYNEYRN